MEEAIRYLLIGGGLASASAAEKIREGDPDGSILIVGAEKHPPYDRPPFSKNFLMDDEMTPDQAGSKPDDFYSSHHVRLHTGVRATRIDREARSVLLDDGSVVRYEKLLLAMGARPNPLNVPGHDLTGVFLLRTADDSEMIRTAIRNSRRAVMVGSGFIGMEVASAATQRNVAVTVVAPEERPWERLTSPAFGKFIRGYYEARGVTFLFGDEVIEFEGDSTLKGVKLKSGGRIEADMAVVAIGVSMNTELAKDAGLELGGRDCVKVDEHLRTSDPHIWAAGDIAEFQDAAMEKRWHIEHYMNATWQGEAAGANMAGAGKPFDRVPYFFSDIFDLSLILRGDPSASKETKVLGDLEGGEFVELYPDDAGRLRMGIALSHDYDTLEPISDKIEAHIRSKTPVENLTQESLTG